MFGVILVILVPAPANRLPQTGQGSSWMAKPSRSTCSSMLEPSEVMEAKESPRLKSARLGRRQKGLGEAGMESLSEPMDMSCERERRAASAPAAWCRLGVLMVSMRRAASPDASSR